MKTHFTLIALSLCAGLIADECCDPNPCCVPEPKKMICTEAYTPAFYDLQCDWGVFASVDFLYWYAGETNLQYAVKGETSLGAGPTDAPIKLSINDVELKHLKTKWDPGVRVGLGLNLCDGWDLYANWTYYHNETHQKSSVDSFDSENSDVGQFALIDPWYNFNLFPQAFLFDRISAKWILNYNVLDLELGRKFWLSNCFSLRPYVGLRGAWISTRFNVDASGQSIVTGLGTDNYIDSQDHFHNRNWGVGLSGGLQPNWYFTEEFSLFGNVEGALLWGNNKNRDKERYNLTVIDTGLVTSLVGGIKNRFSRMQAALDFALGLRWEHEWCDRSMRSTLDAGWEHHIWFNYNTRVRGSDPQTAIILTSISETFNTTYDEVVSDLALGGLVIRARLDF